ELLTMISENVVEEKNEKISELKKRRDQLENSFNQQRELEYRQEALQNRLTVLDDQLVRPEANEAAWKSMQDRINAANQPIKQVEQLYRTAKVHSKDTIKEEDRTNDASTGMKNNKIDFIFQYIKKTFTNIEKLTGYQYIINDLTEKHPRLYNRTLTIVLISAFTIEKSSFVIV